MEAPQRVPKPYVGATRRAPEGVVGGQFSAVPEGEVVVFLIGMRFNRWRRIRSWWPVFVSMPRMLRELAERPGSGLLAPPRTYWSGRDVLLVQYWRSVEDLGAYAKDANLAHVPAWSAFNRTGAATADVGIWHETYTVRPEQVESLYGNMPIAGLAAATAWAPRVRRTRSKAGERMGQREPEYVPDTA
ncbi:MAG TPA: DUF4188 domain-containing protein [Pseudonocardia sp.]|nr:DUF4188 domain-containing protein [Pseudonocardia sp.]